MISYLSLLWFGKTLLVAVSAGCLRIEMNTLPQNACNQVEGNPKINRRKGIKINVHMCARASQKYEIQRRVTWLKLEKRLESSQFSEFLQLILSRCHSLRHCCVNTWELTYLLSFMSQNSFHLVLVRHTLNTWYICVHMCICGVQRPSFCGSIFY